MGFNLDFFQYNDFNFSIERESVLLYKSKTFSEKISTNVDSTLGRVFVLYKTAHDVSNLFDSLIYSLLFLKVFYRTFSSCKATHLVTFFDPLYKHYHEIHTVLLFDQAQENLLKTMRRFPSIKTYLLSLRNRKFKALITIRKQQK